MLSTNVGLVLEGWRAKDSQSRGILWPQAGLARSGEVTWAATAILSIPLARSFDLSPRLHLQAHAFLFACCLLLLLAI